MNNKVILFLVVVGALIFSFYEKNKIEAKRTLEHYLWEVNELNFEKANDFLLVEKKYNEIPYHVRFLLTKITRNSTHEVKKINFVDINNLEFIVEEKNPLTFDIVKNYREQSKEDIENINIELFMQYLDEVLQYEDYFEITLNKYILRKIKGQWKIIPLGKTKK